MIGAVDIGGTKIAVGVVDEQGRVLRRTEAATEAERGYAVALQKITDMLGEVSREAGARLRGVGIGSTGMLDALGGELLDADFLPGWEGKNPVKHLSRTFGVSVAMENDGDAGALAEGYWGAAKGTQRVVYVTIGTGIGGGIILDGQLYRGVDGAHPEIGHHVMEASGPECTCGFRGCWEALAAGSVMEKWYEENRPAAERDGQRLSARQICDLARRGNEFAKRTVEREGMYLGLGLANLISMFVPEVIVLGGGMMQSADLYLGKMREVIRSGCRFVPAEKTEIVLAALGEDTNLIGAAAAWVHRFGGKVAGDEAQAS
jgi:glucokinase